MRTNSLALRLFLSGGGWPGIILLIPGFVLSSLYRDAAERSFDRRLNVFLRTLVAEVAAPDDSSERTPQSLGEPQFDLPLSGWYWQLTRLNAARPEGRSARSLGGWRPSCCSPPCPRCASAPRRAPASPKAWPRSAPAPPSGWPAASRSRSSRSR